MGRGGVEAHLSRVEVLRSRGRCSGRGDQGRDFGIPALGRRRLQAMHQNTSLLVSGEDLALPQQTRPGQGGSEGLQSVGRAPACRSTDVNHTERGRVRGHILAYSWLWSRSTVGIRSLRRRKKHRVEVVSLDAEDGPGSHPVWLPGAIRVGMKRTCRIASPG